MSLHNKVKVHMAHNHTPLGGMGHSEYHDWRVSSSLQTNSMNEFYSPKPNTYIVTDKLTAIYNILSFVHVWKNFNLLH